MTTQLSFSDESSAVFNAARTHRYILKRPALRSKDSAGMVLFVMLNPSTADEVDNDPTIRRCIGFARSWGYASLVVANLFSLRSTDPRALYSDTTAEGDPDNLAAIVSCAREPWVNTVCAWGVHGALRGRGEKVRRELERRGARSHHLGLTKDGHPRHPLYLRSDTKMTRWDARGGEGRSE